MILLRICLLLVLLGCFVYGLENSVIDVSHHNDRIDFNKVKNAGIKAIIHKATQGISYRDPKYGKRKSEAESRNLLWGAYHFGTNHNGTAQAEHFLKTVDCGCGNKYPILALDIEENGGNTMSLTNAEAFVEHIKEKTGKCPLIYGGYYLKQIVSKKSTVLTSCPLWLSQYSNQPSMPQGWSDFTLWQYTDGSSGSDPK